MGEWYSGSRCHPDRARLVSSDIIRRLPKVLSERYDLRGRSLESCIVLTVACVLKSGGEFTPHHVDQLRDGVARNLSLPHRFVCFSDMEVDCERIPLKHGWRGWFSKLELFDGRLTGPILYSDLDAIIVGPIDGIALGHRFTMLKNFWAEAYGDPKRVSSALMAWDADLSLIYRAFAAHADRYIEEYTTRDKWGDQAFIAHHTPIEPDRWQFKHAGKVVSFKKHVLPARRVPEDAAICCFHGQPRPWGLKQHERAWFARVSEAA